MKATHKVFSLFFLCTLVLFAQKLIFFEDFEQFTGPSLAPLCKSNGGELSLFMEDLTWNKCGQLKISKIKKLPDGHEKVNAAVWIGGRKNKQNNKTEMGFECKANTQYQFSIDIRGNASRMSVSAHEWQDSSDLWKFKKTSTSLGNIKIHSEWTNYKGSFKTGEDAKSAALYLLLWASTEHGPLNYKIGDHVLFDNIRIEEVKMHSMEATANTQISKEISPVKTAATENCVIADFTVLYSGQPITADTKAKISADEKGILLEIDCEEPVEIVKATNGLWSGDVVEIFFGPMKKDRVLSQFVIGPGGETYTGRGLNEHEMTWKHEVAIENNLWKIKAHIPFLELGWENPKEADVIAFNLGRQRKKAKEKQSWTALRTGFHDVDNFGRLLLGSYPNEMTRKEFEEFQARQETDELEEKFTHLANSPFLIAQMKITDDNTLPYLPGGLFNPPEIITLNAAINEMVSLPLAIANNTEQTQEYRITLESPVTARLLAALPTPFPGSTARQAVAMRDNKDAAGALLDVLPKMNEASTISIAAKEASMVFFDINTAGFAPGLHKGVLRIIPLTGKGGFSGNAYWRQEYSGEMREIPFELDVRNIVLSKEPARPGSYSSFPPDKGCHQLAHELGQRAFHLNIWGFNFKLKDGKFIDEPPSATNDLQKAKDFGIRRLIVAYSAWDTFIQLYKRENIALFPEWVKLIAKYLKEYGFKLEECEIETFDEPDPKRLDEVLTACRQAKAAAPELKVLVAFGARIMFRDYLEQLFDYIDVWYFWRQGYFSRPEHLEFLAKLKSNGKLTRHYTCATNPRSPLHSNHRINAWFGELHQLDFDAMYHLIDIRNGWYWHAPTAGELLMRSQNATIPTMRYMAVRQGVEDVKYLAKLRSLKNPEANKFLENAAKRVMENLYDPNMPDIVREEAAQLILKIEAQK